MSFIGDRLLLLSAASLGLFVGAMRTEEMVLVPYWRSSSPAAFLRWYAANDHCLLGFSGPLPSATALLAVAAALAARGTGHSAKGLAVVTRMVAG